MRSHAKLAFEIAAPGYHILQSNRAKFHNVVSPVPAIVWVINGQKRVSTDRERQEASEGVFILLPENKPITVENIPAKGNPYEARVIAFERKVFERAYEQVQVDEGQRRLAFQTTVASEPIRESFMRAREAILAGSELPRSIVDSRCEEAVLWLAETGAVLPWAQPASLSDRIRSVVASNPSHKWTSAEVAFELATSEATIRRRLSQEGPSFRAILLDVRMVTALTYLQTTNWRIGRIANSVGYSSQTCFSERFRERFGTSPKSFRGNEVTLRGVD